MTTVKRSRWSLWSAPVLVLVLTFVATSGARADDGDPPTRVARLAYIDGTVSMQPGGTDDWIDAPLNRPLTTGDSVWSDANSRVELQLDGSLLRLASRTSLSLLNVDDHVTQLQLTSGTLIVRVRRLDDGETYEIDTPNLALSLLQPGIYRIAVDDSGSTTVAVRRGEGQVTGGGADFTIDAGQQMVFTGTDSLTADNQPYGQSPFDVWSASRDTRWDHSVSAQYVSPDVVGYNDLDDQGDWTSTPDYGYVWFPRSVQPGWAPYHNGHWAYIAPWGYTWVDDQRWGFAPFHYGRWVSLRGHWGWVPAPPRPRNDEAYVRPVYAPALVAWVGGGAAVAWFALGPREVYVPSYPVSRGYVNNINVSNTVVNRTVVENVYNTTIINNRNVNNRTLNVTNVNYMNRGVPGAIAATSTGAFTSAQSVANHPVQFDPRSGRVQAFAPADVPTRQAFVGQGRLGAPRPPAALQSRGVVARTAPPAPPPSFERRVQAIQQNGGRPLSMAAVRQLQPQAAERPAPIRLAPQATAGGNRPNPAARPSPPNGPQDQRQLQQQQRQQAQQQAEQQRQQQNQAQQQRQAQDRQQQQQVEQQRQQQNQAQQQQVEQQRQQQNQAQQQRQAQARQQQQQDLAARQQQQEQQRQQQNQAAQQQRQAQQQQEQEARRQQAEQQRQQADQQRQQVEQQRQQAQQQQQQQQQQALEQQRAQNQAQRQQEQKPPQTNQTKPTPPGHEEKPGKPDHPPTPNQ